jgi:class 3 adenylate cyclase/tetratricopeptide (TPR) repeat protein
MQCPQCQHEVPAGNKFCGECGARMELTCPACSAKNPPANKFCGECGGRLTSAPAPAPAPAGEAAAVSPPAPKFASPETYTPKHLAEKILTSKAALEGERKQVTVMFTDVSGFTSISETLDPEEVHAIMDRAFEVILQWVHHYEGTINQFLGDGVMALFGAPVAHEDHADRAMRAALAIQAGLDPLREDVRRTHEKEFRMRIGINTGLVVVGAIGRDLRMDYTAVGDTTNLAARLLNVAKPGQIVVSQRTLHPREALFAFEDLGLFEVKGKREPVRAYAVTGEIVGRNRLEVSKERGLTPMVGRQAERQRLDAAFERARQGNGGAVLVSGEPGVGKSRLLYEFLRQLEPSRTLELEATCVSYGQAIAYRPVLDLVRRYLDLPETVTDDVVRGAAAERLNQLGLMTDEAATLLAHFLGVSAPPEFLARVQGAQLKERTHQLLAQMLARASVTTPVVLVIENLHWIDASSEEFLKSLARVLPEHRMLVLLTTRPGPDTTARWLPPGTETIALEGLDPSHLRDMVGATLGADVVADPLFRLLLAKGEGNPLYVEEIVRQLQETGGIALEGGEARLSADSVSVPDTINDIISARVDRLVEDLKHTLQISAVVGRRFGVSLVSRVLAGEGAASGVDTHLRELHTLDFVFPSDDDPEVMYSFKHALTQEVVYGSLLERRRRGYHAAVAAGLEELYAGNLDEVVELLAHHFDRGGEGDKAVDYAIRAAEKAQRRWANVEALAQFEAALKRLASMPDTEANRLRRIDAVIKQSEVKFALGRHAEHVGALEAIKDLVDAVADPPRRASWYYWTGFLSSLVGGRPDTSIAYCREALTIADASGFDDVRPFAECCLSHVLMAAGDLRGAIDVGERALATFEARGNVWWACRTLWALSPVANYLGEWERGLEYCRRALEHGQSVDDLRLKVVGWWRTGSTHVQRGDPEPGLRCCQEALALGPSPFDTAMVRAVRGYGLVKAGDVADGLSELGEAVTWFERSELHYTRSLFALWLAEGRLAAGQRSEARALLEAVLTTTRDKGYRHLEGVAERLLAETLGPETAAGGDHLAVATRILDEVDARNDLGKALVAEARRAQATGDTAGARACLEQAEAIFKTLGTVDGPRLVTSLRASLS